MASMAITGSGRGPVRIVWFADSGLYLTVEPVRAVEALELALDRDTDLDTPDDRDRTEFEPSRDDEDLETTDDCFRDLCLMGRPVPSVV